MSVQSFTKRIRKRVRRYLAFPKLQAPYRLLYRIALVGMNYGGAGSHWSAGDEVGIERLRVRSGDGRTPIVFDVGANVGGYVELVLGILGDDVTVHAFEPSRAAFERLTRLLGKRPNVHLVDAGVGSTNHTATLWSDAPGSVLASTFVGAATANARGEQVQLITIDGYCKQTGVSNIDLLKLDLEGGELDALRGARDMIESGAVESIQFEFGQPSIGARTYFADLFGLLSPRYDIYRVLPRGLERIADYHETLEVFMSTNYLAIMRATVRA